MKMLALETSSNQLSVAIFENEKKVVSLISTSDARHSDTLAPLIQRALKKARWKAKELEAVAVDVGPGSFTGLRVGVTTAKVLAYTLGLKMIAVTSLEVIARQQSRDGTYGVCIDAKKGQVYSALYQKSKSVWKLMRPPAISDRLSWLESLDTQTTILEGIFPSAVSVAHSAIDRIKRKSFDDVMTLEPLYLHPKDCNVHQSPKK